VEEKVNEYLKKYASAKQAKKEIDPDELKEQIESMLHNQKALETLEGLVDSG
jgi:hypothetical protein